MSTGYESEWQRVYSVDKDPIRQHLIYPAIDTEILAANPRRLVDAGCGNGGLLWRYRSQPFAEAIGFDTSDEFIGAAAQQFSDDRVKFVPGDLMGRAPVPDGWADLVSCVFVLNEVPVLSKAVHELSRMLEVNGTLVVIMTHPFQVIYDTLGGGPPKLTGELDYFQTHQLEYHFTLSKAKARYFNYNFEDLVAAFTGARLQVRRLRELTPNAEAFKAYPQYWEKRTVPLYLLVTAVKSL